MLARLTVSGVLLAAAIAVAAHAQPADRRSGPQPFVQRMVAILNAGGTPDTIQSRLDRVGIGLALTHDQRIAVDAIRTLVRSKGRAKGPSMAEAEAFAARHPESPASSFLLAEASLANEQPQRSADMLIATAARAGSLLELVSPATVSKLVDQLDRQSDKRRTADLAKALLGAGWSRGSAGLRSYLAMAAIRDELAAARVDSARRLLPAVRSPASLHAILVDDRLAPLRGDVVRLAGPRLERAWRQYLTGTRDEWLERGDVVSASAYAEALKQANQHEALVSAFLPRFMRGYNCPSDPVARTIAADVADSLAKTGRWTKAEDVMRRSGGVSAAIYGAMLLERGAFGRAAPLFQRSLSAAGAPDDIAEEKGIAWLRAAGNCAAFRDSKRAAVERYDPMLLDVAARLFVMLCMDKTEEARASLLAALADDEERADALRWVQPFSDPPVQSAFRKEMSERIRALQRDPGVVEATRRFGRILDWPLTSAVPGPAELGAGRAAAPWQCGDQSDWEAMATQPETIRLPDSQP